MMDKIMKKAFINLMLTGVICITFHVPFVAAADFKRHAKFLSVPEYHYNIQYYMDNRDVLREQRQERRSRRDNRGEYFDHLRRETPDSDRPNIPDPTVRDFQTHPENTSPPGQKPIAPKLKTPPPQGEKEDAKKGIFVDPDLKSLHDDPADLNKEKTQPEGQ